MNNPALFTGKSAAKTRAIRQCSVVLLAAQFAVAALFCLVIPAFQGNLKFGAFLVGQSIVAIGENDSHIYLPNIAGRGGSPREEEGAREEEEETRDLHRICNGGCFVAGVLV